MGATLAFAPAQDPLLPDFPVPRLARGSVQLWLMPASRAETRWQALLASLAGKAPSALELARGAHGKPEIPGSELRFSVSRTPRFVLFAVTRRAGIGVDIEWLGRRVRRPQGLLERCYSARERASIAAAQDPRRALLEAWCDKEAVVKGIGRGIAFGLRRVHLEAGAAWIERDGAREHWRLWRLEPAPDHVGALASRDPGLSLEGYRIA